MNLRSYAILLLFFVGLFACKKNGVDTSPAESSDNPVAVYAAGYVYDGTSNTATYWTNGTPVLLPPQTNGDDNSFAYAMAVSGNNTYVAGSGPTGTGYWKNGVFTALAGNSAEANAIVLSGKDVYIAGSEYLSGIAGPQAVYWKNGSTIVLQSLMRETVATGIALSGNDIYVSGITNSSIPLAYATYWKNGVPVLLTDSSMPSSTSGIAVSGNDVYVAGNESVGNGIAIYWKNNTPVPLNYGSVMGSASAIAVSGNDVYVTGSIYNPAFSIFNAVYWKNGQIVYLTDRSLQSMATSISISGNDVYIGGMVASPNGSNHYNQFAATYWKNGNAVTLPYQGGAGYRYVYAVFVAGG